MFGTKVTAEQKKLLTTFKKVVIAFDGDAPGIENSDKLANDLCVFTDVELLTLPEGDDPDKLCKDDVKFIRSKIGK
jgi:DNA primase